MSSFEIQIRTQVQIQVVPGWSAQVLVCPVPQRCRHSFPGPDVKHDHGRAGEGLVWLVIGAGIGGYQSRAGD